MKIYTKTGDKGETSLLGGTRVSKAHAKLEAYGTVDELNSSLGIVAAGNALHQQKVLQIQHLLFNIGSLLAVEREVSFELPSIAEDDITWLEKEMDVMNEHLPALKNFILPGGSTISAQAHLSRCICRRAERRVVALNDEKYNLVVQYLNRLSDYLFVLSRDILHQEGINEVIWQKK
jgi:cob(I)alamin adenosyltransferase